MDVRKYILAVSVMAALRCWGTQYYVSNAGSDANNGTSPATAWQTLAHVNGQTFSPGDTILLQRGGVWNEQLIPASSGAAGNPISFDAYGTGAAPVITAASAIPFVSGSWSYVSGNVWKATMTSTIASATVNLVQFGKLYGMKRGTSNCTSVVANKYDWCVIWPWLYVNSPAGTNPVATYAADGAIVPIIAQGAGLQMIYVNGKTSRRHRGTRGMRPRCTWIIRCKRLPVADEPTLAASYQSLVAGRQYFPFYLCGQGRSIPQSRRRSKGMTLTEREVQALRVLDGDFQREVLEKLGRLEAKVDMLVGNGQPGRMKLAEDRILALEKNDVRRTVIERLINASTAIVISGAIALHGLWWK